MKRLNRWLAYVTADYDVLGSILVGPKVFLDFSNEKILIQLGA